MGNPQRFLVRVLVFLAIAAAVAAILLPVLERAFRFNPWLNGLIFASLLIGIVYNLRRILSLRGSLEWLDGVKSGVASGREIVPRLVAPIATAIADRDRRSRGPVLAPAALRHLLDTTADRLDESRDIARYLTGLLIFLGLLGTFWGLLEAIGSISGVITGMSIGSGDLAAVFEDMKAGLAKPLDGMGTAFGSSLFGLASSLVLGFLDLQATQAQNGFVAELEEWLVGITRHQLEPAPLQASSSSLTVAAPTPAPLPIAAAQPSPLPSYVQGLLQQTAEQLVRMQEAMARDDDQRSRMARSFEQIGAVLGELSERIGRQQDALGELARAQTAIAEELLRRADQPLMLDETTRAHVRNIERELVQLAEGIERGRIEQVRELRGEIRLVSRTIAAAAGEPQLLQD